MNTKTKYSFEDIIAYFCAIVAFIFFGVFAIADISKDSLVWVKFIKICSIFPYIFLLHSMWDFAKITWKERFNDNEQDLFVNLLLIFFIISITLVMILISTSWLFYDDKNITFLSKVTLMIGLVVHMVLHMKPSVR